MDPTLVCIIIGLSLSCSQMYLTFHDSGLRHRHFCKWRGGTCLLFDMRTLGDARKLSLASIITFRCSIPGFVATVYLPTSTFIVLVFFFLQLVVMTVFAFARVSPVLSNQDLIALAVSVLWGLYSNNYSQIICKVVNCSLFWEWKTQASPYI